MSAPDISLPPQQMPDLGPVQTPTPVLAGSPGSPQAQAAQNQPPRPSPILLNLIRGLAHPQMQAPAPGEEARPVSRLSTFEDFLGNFVNALGHGLAAGRGPGAFGKGFGAAVGAPYEQDIQRFQLGQQAQANQAEIQQRQAQSQLEQAQAKNIGQMVTLPNGWTVPLPLAQKLAPTLFANQTKEDIANKKIASTEKIAAQTSTDRGSALRAKIDMFHQSQEYQNYRAKLAASTKLKVAQITAGKAPAQMMQTATFAQSGLNRMNDAQAAFDDLTQRGVLGSVTSDKLENWVFGNGLIDPSLPPKDREEIGKLRAALSYTSSAAMRAHTGRTSREIYDDFKNTLGLNQGEDALRGAFEETGKMLNDYATSASDASVRALRSGFPGRAQPNETRQSNGRRIIDLTK